MNSTEYIETKLKKRLIGPEYVELLREILTDDQAVIYMLKDVDGLNASQINECTGNIYGEKLIQELISFIDDYLKVDEPFNLNDINLFLADSTRRFQNLDILEKVRALFK